MISVGVAVGAPGAVVAVGPGVLVAVGPGVVVGVDVGVGVAVGVAHEELFTVVLLKVIAPVCAITLPLSVAPPPGKVTDA